MMDHISEQELREYLEVKYRQYNAPEFILSDPVQIPHQFRKKEDREIAGFLAATIAWGQRPVIIRNAHRMLEIMNNEPFKYLTGEGFRSDKEQILSFVHRTFSGKDLMYFFKALSKIYKDHGGLEQAMASKPNDMQVSISSFKELFLSFGAPEGTGRHVSDPKAGSAAKRLNMFLRWMVRKDEYGVDLGIWKKIKPADLYLPLDVHSGNVARSLGLLTRKQDDWKAVEEVTSSLKKFDAKDPVKYDFALFGIGIFEGREKKEN